MEASPLMGKRTRDNYDDFKLIAKKIKKLEEQYKRVRRKDRDRRSLRSSTSTSSSSSASSSSRSRSQTPVTIRSLPEPPYIEGVPITPSGPAGGHVSPRPPASAVVNEPLPCSSSMAVAQQPSTSAAAYDPIPSTSSAVRQIEQVPNMATDSGSAMPPAVDQTRGLEEQPPELDDELLKILGEDPSQLKTYGKDIQIDLAVRLQHVATSGLTKEARKELLDKHLPPANCVLIDAPALNPEAVFAITVAVLKRDKGIELRQKQRASAVSCIAEALSLLITSEPKNTTIIQLLMDATKLMCDSQATDSLIRRSFVLNGLKKDLKDQLQATKIDKLLFGEKLAETLRAAKALSRSGAEMKPPPDKQTVSKRPQTNLNWRVPPLSQRPKGIHKKEPFTPKNRPASSSKRSSHPAQSRSHNRR